VGNCPLIFNKSNKMKNKLTEKIYVLKNGKSPLTFVLQSRHSRRSPLLWFDEEKGVNRTLRYARNQRSPFEDEQDDNAIVEPIMFENGVLKVSKTDTVLHKFLELHPKNGSVFEEFIAERDAEKEIEEMNYEVDALIAAREMSIDKCEEILRELIGSRVENMTSKEVRRDILVFARNNPYDLLTMAGDPDVQMKNNIAQFFDMNIIQFRNKNKDVYFNLPNNKKRMLTVPEGEDGMDAVKLFFETEEGEPIYNKLCRELD
jgi:hypothetical protein